jgi:hypothetical protein
VYGALTVSWLSCRVFNGSCSISSSSSSSKHNSLTWPVPAQLRLQVAARHVAQAAVLLADIAHSQPAVGRSCVRLEGWPVRCILVPARTQWQFGDTFRERNR